MGADGQSITSAANDRGVPRLFRVPIDGRSPALLVQEYSVDPVWGARWPLCCLLGTRHRYHVFGEKPSRTEAVSASSASPYPDSPELDYLTFLRGGRALVFLRGEIQHKDLWLIDMETGNRSAV